MAPDFVIPDGLNAKVPARDALFQSNKPHNYTGLSPGVWQTFLIFDYAGVGFYTRRAGYHEKTINHPALKKTPHILHV